MSEEMNEQAMKAPLDSAPDGATGDKDRNIQLNRVTFSQRKRLQ